MTRDEAKEVLMLFRPGTADEQDAAFAEARQLARTDTELARWFDEHCASYLALRRKFQEIPVPPGLREQILSERKVIRPFYQRHLGPLLAAAAAVILLLGLEGDKLFPGFAHNPHTQYLTRMTEWALRNYYMTLETNQLGQIDTYLESHHAPVPVTLPAGLEHTDVLGCMVTTWQDNHVSMICFKTGRPLDPGFKADLWLFVADRASVPHSPKPGEAPAIRSVNKALTASWSDQKNTYVLAMVGDESLLNKYLH